MKKGTIAVAVLGAIAGVLIIWQLVSGLILHGGSTARMHTAHLHGGLTTATVALLYIFLSVVLLLNPPAAPPGRRGE